MLADGLCGQPSEQKVSRNLWKCRKRCIVSKIQALKAESAVLFLKNLKSHARNSLGALATAVAAVASSSSRSSDEEPVREAERPWERPEPRPRGKVKEAGRRRPA